MASSGLAQELTDSGQHLRFLSRRSSCYAFVAGADCRFINSSGCLFEGFDELLCLPALQGVEAH